MCKDNIDKMRYAYNSIKNRDKKRTTANKPCQIHTISPAKLKLLGETLLFALFFLFFVMVYDPLPNICTAQFMFFEPFSVFVIKTGGC